MLNMQIFIHSIPLCSTSCWYSQVRYLSGLVVPDFGYWNGCVCFHVITLRREDPGMEWASRASVYSFSVSFAVVSLTHIFCSNWYFPIQSFSGIYRACKFLLSIFPWKYWGQSSLFWYVQLVIIPPSAFCFYCYLLVCLSFISLVLLGCTFCLKKIPLLSFQCDFEMQGLWSVCPV